MSSWAGFTDEELLRLRQTAGEDRTAPGSLRKSAINTAKRQRPREKVRSRGTSSGKLDSGKKEGNEDQGARDCAQLAPQNTSSRSNGGRSTSRLDSREEEKENSSPECERRGKSVSQVKERNSLPKESSLETKSLKNANDQQGKAFEVDDGHQEQSGILTDKEVEIDLPNIIDENDRIQAIELSALEKMQEKQKQIEQENKRKKAALQETIKKRYQKTQAEAHTLSLVQKELSHLDSLLSADVAILRDKIEESSRDFLSAQKRYEKAEKEFVEAKMDLHRKTERKDLLTEHLYTIIRENELRKAKKLEELMVKLNVGNDVGFSAQNEGDEAIMEQNNPEIPVLSEDKARREIPESNSGSALHPCHAVEDKTPIEQTEVDMAKQKMLSEAVSEKEVTVPT
ncbi:RAB6-interacting golgin [Pocillopora verrucosa]|uniref:RAB6-interacting golgin n=1 Tax=Pocillopora verrucosa TaxID=203993 RepID=UPI0033412D2F